VTFYAEEFVPLNRLAGSGTQAPGRVRNQAWCRGSGCAARCQGHQGVGTVLVTCCLRQDTVFGRVKLRWHQARFLAVRRQLWPICAPNLGIAIGCDNLRPHPITAENGWVGAWSSRNFVEIACTTTTSCRSHRLDS
jgi:hypothetical protein